MSVPPRPSMPTEPDQARSIHQFTRLQILKDDWDDVIGAWLDVSVDSERTRTWGLPDTSSNPLGDMSRQLTTPGLYGVTPTALHAMQPDAAEVLIGTEGQLAKAGHWTKMQSTSYRTVGMGDYAVRIDAPPEVGRLALRPVSPHDLYTEASDHTPEDPYAVWELRLRWFAREERWVFLWEQYDVSNPDEPFYRMAEAETDGSVGLDLSSVFLATDDNPAGNFTGERYPYRYADGTPFLPWTFYRAIDAGERWNQHHKRGVHRGTLNAALFATYASYCAKSCTGDVVMVAGMTPISAATIRSPIETGGRPGVEYTDTSTVQSITMEPGSIMYHTLTDPGVQPFVKQVGAGGALADVAAFSRGYSVDLNARWGGSGADVTRAHANPTSGSSLMIQNEDRRAFARQVAPLFSRADLDLMGKSAAVLNRSGIEGTGSIPETGYTVTYAPIRKSPQERKEDREETDWEIDHDFLSETDAYRRRHPGTSEADARMAIARARVETVKLDQLTADLMAAEGIEPPAEPPPPAEPDDVEPDEDPPEEEES